VSDHEVTLAALATINTKLEWCVAALRYLLSQDAGYQPEAQVEDYEDDEEDLDIPAPTHEPVVTCSHQHQKLAGDRIICAMCGFVLSGGAGLGGSASRIRQPGA
jgi:hypothetical protein